MKSIKGIENPYLLFLPFLLLFLMLVIIFQADALEGDEGRYLSFAQNLLHGYYSSPSPDINLWNGPGYPIILMPFVAFNLPLICVVIMNAVFYYLSIVFLFKALQQIVSFRTALIFSLFWACYYNSFQDMVLIYTETFTALLVTLLMFFLIKAFNSNYVKQTNKYVYLSGFIIGYLVLTKIIFGYVLLFMLIGMGLLWVIRRKVFNYKKGLIIMLIALVTNLPYLFYSYRLTGRVFYWGNSGGKSLYWMSTPFKNEYGDWFGELRPALEPTPLIDKILNLKKNKLDLERYNNSGFVDSLKSHHQHDYDEIYKFKGVEQDDAFKRIAVRNIKSHPAKYIQNCISNIGRLLFSYPFSYTVQSNTTLLRLPLNGILVVLMVVCLIPTFKNWRKIIFPVRFMLLFVFVYLVLSTLVSAYTRMFTITVPILLIWIAFVVQKSINVRLKFNQSAKK